MHYSNSFVTTLFLTEVHEAVAVLLLLLGLPQVDEAQHEGEEDDDQGAEQERHHHALRVRLVAQRRALPAPGLGLILDAAPLLNKVDTL